jgi:hypothetical protein
MLAFLAHSEQTEVFCVGPQVTDFPVGSNPEIGNSSIDSAQLNRGIDF